MPVDVGVSAGAVLAAIASVTFWPGDAVTVLVVGSSAASAAAVQPVSRAATNAAEIRNLGCFIGGS